MVGKIHSFKTKNKMSLSHAGKPSGMNGKKHSFKTILNMRVNRQGIGNSFYGKRHTDECIERNRKRAINQWKDIDLRQQQRIRALNQKHVYKDTAIERIVESELKFNNILYEKQKLINNLVRADFFIEPNIIIECDGAFWHNYPFGKLRDEFKNKKMKDSGYIVYRFWEQDIWFDVKTLIKKIIIQNKIKVA